MTDPVVDPGSETKSDQTTTTAGTDQRIARTTEGRTAGGLITEGRTAGGPVTRTSTTKDRTTKAKRTGDPVRSDDPGRPRRQPRLRKID